MGDLVCALGLVFIIEGLPYFSFPLVMKRLMLAVLEMPEGRLRAFGLGAMVVGLVLVYLARQTALFS